MEMARRLYYGLPIEAAGATIDAELCVLEIMRSYPSCQLRGAGQLDRVLVAKKKLETAIRDDDMAEVCRCSLDFRQSQHVLEMHFGVRYPFDEDTPITPSREAVGAGCRK